MEFCVWFRAHGYRWWLRCDSISRAELYSRVAPYVSTWVFLLQSLHPVLVLDLYGQIQYMQLVCMKLVKAALVSHVHWLSDLFYLTVTVKFSHSSVSSLEQLYTVIHSGSILFGFCWSLCYGWLQVCNLYPLPGSLPLPLMGSSGFPMPFTLSVHFAPFVSFSTLCLLHL